VSILAQIVGNKMSELMKQPVVIDNRPGAGGNVGADLVAKSPPDGYTVLLHTNAQAAAPALYRALPFNPVTDFVPVTMVVATQYVIGGSLKHPATTLRESAADAKARLVATFSYGAAAGQDSLKIAIGQRGGWEQCVSELGQNKGMLLYRIPWGGSLAMRRTVRHLAA
jgi:tripartite-type tricarboxylate transporter receptor subunit TctC